MSKLSALIDEANTGLSIQERIPEARWDAIAKHCGVPELAEIEARIVALEGELATVEEWDGDTQDDIHSAISRFSRLLELADVRGAAKAPGDEVVADVPLKLPWWGRWKN